MVIFGLNSNEERSDDCMKKGVLYFSGICLILTVFAVGNYFSYKTALKHFEKLQKNNENAIYEYVENYVSDEVQGVYDDFEKELDKRDSVPIGASSDGVLGVQTVYQIENYDALSNTTTVEYQSLPESLIGMNRQETDDYCKKCISSMPADEFLKGLQSMGVVKFSSERLVVKKIYDSSKIKYKYYLIAIDGEVVVYYGDKKTVYEYTGIETDKLSKRELNKLKKGIEVKDENELFSILENYSS